MNVLGKSVAKTMRETVVNPSNMIVLQDDLNHAPGTLKAKFGGKPDGHRGIRSINKFVHCEDTIKYHRLLVGIGRSGEVRQYVLGPLSSFEKQYWAADGEGIDQVWQAIERIAQKHVDS